MDAGAQRHTSRLRWSVVVFALVVGALELVYLLNAMVFNGLILSVVAPGPWGRMSVRTAVVAVGCIPLATVLGAALCWWLIVVVARHVTPMDGGFAGLLSVIVTDLILCLTLIMTQPSYPASSPLERLPAAITIWLVTLIDLLVGPFNGHWTWEILWIYGAALIPVVAGALYGARLRRSLDSA